MYQRVKTIAAVLMVLVFALQIAPIGLAADTSVIATSPTGYTTAEDVEYVIVGNTVVNWGARNEDCTFLTYFAETYYTESYSWDQLSDLDGGTGTSDAYTSQLYKALQEMMQTKHTKLQGYQDTRQFYQYTDCVANDYSRISSFYSGNTVDGTWTGSTYNREHVWPKSKCIYNDKTRDSADIMMLRATITSENSNRGNSAYGESGGYFDPGVSVRGDCARMVLYGYVRWGNIGKMWGTGGVMESLDVLLKWMEEDPVDTWEMGRNDAVQSITGVRNVFVDFPEYAWLLFGEQIPEDMVTPSGNASQKPCTHENTELRNFREADCMGYGYSGDTYCADCGKLLKKGQDGNKLGDHHYGQWQDGGNFFYRYCDYCGETDVMPYNCVHEQEELRNEKAATCAEDGYSGDIYCLVCGMQISTGEVIPATGEHNLTEWITVPGGGKESRWCSNCDYEEYRGLPACPHEDTDVIGEKTPTCTEDGYTGDTLCIDCGCFTSVGEVIPATGHQNTLQEIPKSASCVEDGYTGDKRCTDCGEILEPGKVIPATGQHDFSEWVTDKDTSRRSCKNCGFAEIKKDNKDEVLAWDIILIAVVSITVSFTCVFIGVSLRKRKK